MSEAPKLYVHKPKKAQIKQSKVMEAQPSSSTVTPPSSSSTGNGYGGASQPPEVPKQPFLRRYKFLVPLVLTVNLAIGAYLFTRTKKKDIALEEETTDAAPTSTSVPTPSPTTSATVESLPVAPVTRVQEPIPEQQQRELFKWMLDEKRKIKTKDPEEKKRIDEEKAILKQFIRAKSIPSI
ncbi:unnamed protein product [Amaranthus hypochondriacus]